MRAAAAQNIPRNSTPGSNPTLKTMSEEQNRLDTMRKADKRKKKKARRKKAVEARKYDEDLKLQASERCENSAKSPQKSDPVILNGTSSNSHVPASLNGGILAENTRTDALRKHTNIPGAANSGRKDATDAYPAAMEPPRRFTQSNADAPPVSPRKMALLRQKKSAEGVNEPAFVSEVNEKKKNRRSSPPVEPEDGKYPMLLAGQNMDGKAQLFAAPASQIVVYHEQLQNQRLQTSGTLLAHGEFEIFQLHNGDVTYLACGRSFVYPLLPRLKILRTSRSEFVLPLVNPDRYWKIHVDSASDAELLELQRVLKEVVNYTNLAVTTLIGRKETREQGDLGAEETLEAVVSEACGKSATGAFYGEERMRGNENGEIGENGARIANHYTPFFNDIPESPPSVPVLPQQPLFDEQMDLLPLALPQSKNTRKPSGQSITSAMASFNLDPGFGYKPLVPNPQLPNQITHSHTMHPVSQLHSQNHHRGSQRQGSHIHNPRVHSPQVHSPQVHSPQIPSQVHNGYQPIAKISELPKVVTATHSNPFYRGNFQKHPDKKHERKKLASSSSSMDSLLDEYEENISTTQSIRYISRPPSRGNSYVSTVRSGVINRNPSRFGSEAKNDDFPSTSLSQYDKARQSSVGGRSRKSSVSELYSSVSNWMEPGRTGPKLSHSKSIQSLASKKSTGRHVSGHLNHNLSHGNLNSNLNDTYREIYRSITLHNLSHIVEGSEGHLPRKPQPTGLSKSPSMAEIRERRAPKGDGLSSAQVYKLLSERDEKQKPSGLRRLFGW